MVRIHKSARQLELVAASYRLVFDRQRPWNVLLTTTAGTPILDLFLGSSVDPPGDRDTLEMIDGPKPAREGETTLVTFAGRSSRWDVKRYVLACGDATLAYRVEVQGSQDIARCHLCQGYLTEDLRRLGLGTPNFRGGYRRPVQDLARGSAPHFSAYFTARPTAAEADLRGWWVDETFDLIDDPGRFGGLDAFLPALPALALESGPTEPWAAMGIATTPERSRFARVTYRAGRQGGIELAYDTPLAVGAEWRSPDLLFVFGGRDPLHALRRFRDELAERSLIPAAAAAPPVNWWTDPVWDGRGRTAPQLEADLAALEAAGCQFRTIWLGDDWLARDLAGVPNRELWPRLREWIAAHHEAGRRVVLGWPLDGAPVGLTPGGQDHDDWLRERVAWLLGGDGLAADGLRLTWLGRAAQRQCSFAQLHHAVGTLREAAAEQRPDALVAASVGHPMFADRVDLVTLGSLWSDRRWVEAALRHRAEIARLGSPHWLIGVGDWAAGSPAVWREVVRLMPELGVPVVSTVGGVAPAEAAPDDLALLAAMTGGRR